MSTLTKSSSTIMLKKANVTDYLTVSEAAQRLGVTEYSVRNYLSRGILQRYHFKSLVLLQTDEVLTYLAHRAERPGGG